MVSHDGAARPNMHLGETPQPTQTELKIRESGYVAYAARKPKSWATTLAAMTAGSFPAMPGRPMGQVM